MTLVPSRNLNLVRQQVTSIFSVEPTNRTFKATVQWLRRLHNEKREERVSENTFCCVDCGANLLHDTRTSQIVCSSCGIVTTADAIEHVGTVLPREGRANKKRAESQIHIAREVMANAAVKRRLPNRVAKEATRLFTVVRESKSILHHVDAVAAACFYVAETRGGVQFVHNFKCSCGVSFTSKKDLRIHKYSHK